MNSTMTTPDSTGLEDSLAFLAFPAKRAAEQVAPNTQELVRTITVLIDVMLSAAIDARSGDEFRAVRTKYIARYMQVMIALGSLISASLDEEIIDRLTAESLDEMEEQFRTDRQVLGEEIGEQAAFTVWTFRKINDLAHACNSKGVANNLAEADSAFAQEYVRHVLYSRFHLDCLRMATALRQPLFPEIVQEISDGLRSAVDAYAWIRQGHHLRLPNADEAFDEMEWDEEQNQLLHESTAELLRESY